MQGKRSLLGATVLLAAASASLLVWQTLSRGRKAELRKRVRVLFSRLSLLSSERSQGAASEKEESGLSAGEAQKVLSRDDVKEIMEALLTSAREAEKNLADCIADNQMSPKVDVDQTEAIAILIKSCAPLKIVRESTKEKFNVSEAEMIEAMDLYKTADEEIMELNSKIASAQLLISEKSKILVSLLAPAKLDRSAQKANEVAAT